MKNLIFVSILILNVLTAFSATEPVIKINMDDGSPAKIFNIDDIEQMSIMKIVNNYEMIVFSKNNLTTNYQTPNIDSIKYEVNANQVKILNVYLKNSIIKAHNLIDIDSIIFTFNTCNEIQIGDQIWMCKNLNVDHYRNGDSIPEVRDSIQWVNLKTGAWCYYNNDPELGKIYGKHYNHYAVTDKRGLAPKGWHVASGEWALLKIYLGYGTASGKLKETGTLHWNKPNLGASNMSGFTALPGGVRDLTSGNFVFLGMQGQWWTGIEILDENYIYAKYYSLDYNYEGTFENFAKKSAGCSVRCVKDK